MSWTSRPHLEPVAQAAALIEQCDALVIAAGAGIGVDSGLPDFRGREGFWNSYPALGNARIEFERIAAPAAFRAMPLLAWGFYGHRLALYRRTTPHAGFALLMRWGESIRHGCFVFTSNVDGQFQKAGFDRQRIHECHGSIHHLQCLNRCSEQIWRADGFEPLVDEANCRLLNSPPRCPRCGALARPNVLMFDDDEWVYSRSQAQADRLLRWLHGARHPLVIELGAGTRIATVRHFSAQVVERFGGVLIRINPQAAEVDQSGIGLASGALDGLNAIADVLSNGRA